MMNTKRSFMVVLTLICVGSAGAWRPREMPRVPGEVVVQYRSGATARAGIDRVARGDAARAARPASLRALDTKYGLVRSRRVMDAQVDERLRARVRGRDESQNLSVLPPPASHLSPPKRALHRLSALAVLTFDGDAPVDEICAAYRADPNVVAAEPNWVGVLFAVPGDPLYPQQASDLSHIGIEAAWDIQTGSPSVRVAIIDGGVDTTHVDLRGAIDPAGYNFVDNNTNIYDDLDHGTRIAGIIGAVGNNGEGIAGVAYGVQLLVLDVADSSGTIALAHAIAAVDYAVVQGADVVNMSFGFYARSSLFEQACRNATAAGTVLVASAGNENQSTALVYPAGFDSVVGVAAIDSDSAGTERAVFSNYNSPDLNLVDLAAPGVTIFSTVAGSIYDGTMGSGTSYATAVVSGVAALLKSRYPGQSAAGTRHHLLETARRIGDWAGSGMVDAAAALATAPAPRFAAVSIRIDDDPLYNAANDADGHFEPGETASLFVTLRNVGADASTVTGILSSFDPAVTIGDTTGAWGHIDAANERENASDAFGSVAVALGTASHNASLNLLLSTNGGATTQALLIALPIENTQTPPTIIGIDTTWTSDKTYSISDLTVVMDAATLTIEPGTTIRFGPLGKLEVRGSIDALGTSDRRIRFTNMDDRAPGSHLPWKPIPFDSKGYGVAVGDADNNGDNDICYATWGLNGGLALARWNGQGFDPVVNLIPGTSLGKVAIGDIDMDGDNDIVASSAYGYGGFWLFRWNGSDHDTPVFVNSGYTCNSIVIGDADNDGKNDVVTESSVTLIDGTTSATQTLGHGERYDAVVADADNDGLNEVVVARRRGVTIHDIPGPTTSGPVTMLDTGNDPFAVAVGDVDGDGDNDIVTANHVTDDVFVILWNGTGFDEKISVPVGDRPFSVQVADADNDGRNEIATANYGGGSVSLIRWDGAAFEPVTTLSGLDSPYDLAIADATNDGLNDIAVACYDGDSGLFPWYPDSADRPSYGGIWIRRSISSARLEHCDIRFAPVLDESSIASFSDCLFERSGGPFALSSTTGTVPIVRCIARGNGGGDGILAPSKALIGCRGENNAGSGLIGNDMTRCHGEGNAGIGLDSRQIGRFPNGTVTSSTASGNGTWGIHAIGDVLHSTATENHGGIRGRDVTDSVAEGNSGAGMTVTATARRCRVVGNRGSGISASNAESCVIADNGAGLSLLWTASNCFVAHNGGIGVQKGDVSASSIYANAGSGVYRPSAVSNSWIVANRGLGVLGAVMVPTSTPILSEIHGCTITGNRLGGVKNSGPVNSSNIHGNGDASAYEYEVSLASIELQQVDVSGNYWGRETTDLMNQHPWGTYFDIPKIHDFVDDTSLTEARYEGHLQQPANVPDDRPPAFLLQVLPDLTEPASIGKTTFTLTFSKGMDMAVPPAVTFGTTTPYTQHVVVADPGWVTSTTWQGAYAISIETGAGIHTLRVSQATDATGFVIPDDTAHRFEITWGEQHANVGLATAIGSNAIRCTWDSSTRSDLLGYNILRSPTGLPGTYARVNTSLVVTDQFIDTGLESETTYYYIVHEVDNRLNSTQLTPPFQATTLPSKPDLCVRGFDVWPDQVDGGEPIHFAGAVTNEGSRETTGGFEIRFEVSAGLDFGTPRFTLCDPHRVTTTLSAGASFDLATVSATVRTVAQGLPEGAYTVGIIVDALGEVAEEREDNNVTWVSRGKKTLYVGERPTRADRWMLYR